MNKKTAFFLIVILILGLFITIFGASYAFFSSRVTSKDYVITTGNLQLDYTKTGNEINLSNTYPLTNSEGKNTDGYTFNITNTGSISTKYQIRLELDSNNTIPMEYIKLSYVKTKENDTNTTNELSEPALLSNLNATQTFIRNQVINPNKTDSYTLKLWIDYSAPNDIQGKTFKAKIVIDAIQNVEDGYEFDSTAPIITLNKYSDGNIDQILKVGSTYNELGVQSVKDDKDILSPSDVTITGTVDTNKVGVYTITYTVTDSDNNTSTYHRTIAVGDEQSLNIKHSVSDVLAMYTSEQQASNEAISCSVIHGNDDMYLGCNIHDSLKSAFNQHTRGIIIMTSDVLDNKDAIFIGGKELVLNLNGHKLINNSQMHLLYIDNGTLKITGDGLIKSSADNDGNGAIKMYADGGTKLIIEGNRCNSTNPEDYNSGLLIYSENNKVITNSGNKNNDNNPAKLIINGGCYNANNGDAIVLGGITNAEINDAYVVSNGKSINNLSTDTVNIISGVFISNNDSAIYNSAGTININQDKKAVYVTSLSTTTSAAINNSKGTININANQADSCTSDSSATTSGLCVYAEGDKNYESLTSNIAVKNRGNLRINGGSYFGGYYGINNDNNAEIYIKNANILSGNTAIFNGSGSYSTSTANICKSTISGINKDFLGKGVVNYTNDVIFKSGDNTPAIGGDFGTYNSVTVCPF